MSGMVAEVQAGEDEVEWLDMGIGSSAGGGRCMVSAVCGLRSAKLLRPISAPPA